MAQQMYGVRKFLTDQGYNNNDISYDPSRKMVQLQGKDFYGATPESDGSTYGSYNDLSSALNNYRGAQRNSQLDGLVNTMTQKATTAQPFQYKAPNPFSYDPQSDPRYQAALNTAKMNTDQAEGNISADLNRRGIMNSTINSNLGNQAAQREYTHVSNDLLPQFYNQAYNQWADQANRDLQVQQANYNAGQDQFRNQQAASGLLQGLNQQDFTNNRMQQQDHINLANQLSQEYGMPVNPTEDPSQSYAQVAGKQPLNAVAQAFEQMLQTANAKGYFPDGKPILSNDPNSLEGKLKQAQSQYYLDHGNYYDNRLSGSGTTTPSLAAKQQANDFEGSVMSEVGQLDNPDDKAGWLEANRAEITKQLGTDGFDRIKKSVMADAQATNKSNAADAAKEATKRREAISLASRDPEWFDPTKREGLIQNYMQYIQ